MIKWIYFKLSIVAHCFSLIPISGWKWWERSAWIKRNREADGDILGFIPTNPQETERWDREWLHYLCTEDPRKLLMNYEGFKIIGNLRGEPPHEVYHKEIVKSIEVEDPGFTFPLNIWIDGDSIVKKRVLEIGCGPGYLGRQLGLVASVYLGIDHSKLALYIAQLTSPMNCTYLHLSETNRIRKYVGTMDTMVGRNFFIHLNYDTANWVLKLASLLLQQGGLIGAEFYLVNPDIPQGTVYPAKHTLDPDYPSWAFSFTREEITKLAYSNNFTIEDITDNLNLQRRFIILKRKRRP